ncbi:GNAT family N-acetyltransferase [Streptomyces sp. NPDC091371]|uniref:GNAT family N-acetyltransferase n=1 Tax=Streptomyces sp. NPDC091371 TaxID=3155303 RepID=UPI003446278C
MVKVRAAQADEAEALTGLVMRSKAHWGYDAAFLAACAEDLRIRPEDAEARRIVVAEDERGTVLGLASLEGDPPRAVLGLLFVEPAAIGRGVGRLLYRDVLRRAADLGVRTLVIDSDPHAAGFYRAMGADESGERDGLVRFEAAPAPVPEWARVWGGGHGAVHIGNVAEFNTQFQEVSLGRGQRGAHHYSCLAAFYTPWPAALVLPAEVPRVWAELVGRCLGWEGVEVYDGVLADEDPGLSDAVRAHPALAGHLEELGLPLVPWGQSEPFARLAGRRWNPRSLRYESKAAAHAMFGRIVDDGGHPGILLPLQWRARTRRQARRLLAARVTAGQTTVLKTRHGVGGSGTTVVTPRTVAQAGGIRAVMRRLPRGPLLVEEYVPAPVGADGVRDLNYNGFVDGAGRVHEVGVALMDVAGTCYQGATVGPGAVPPWAEKPMLSFGEAVGRELAAVGYRGWFDVDFVADDRGRLAPTETNLRLTGPSVAFMVRTRLDELRGGAHLVRVMDRVELGARLPEVQLERLLTTMTDGCAALGAQFLPAIATAAFDPAPWLGAVVAARTAEALAEAGQLVRTRARQVGDMFAG